jgi:cytochrome c oxidase subunit 1
MHVLGIGGMMRHSYDPTQYDFLKHLQPLNTFVSIAAFVLASSQLIFILNFVWSLVRGPVAVQNPWNANTLEWVPAAPIPHGNWGETAPEVHRWPYEYSVPQMKEDFVPQNLP